MAQQSERQHPFNLITEGMTVQDIDGNKVGAVKTVFFGNVDDRAIETGGMAADSPAVDLTGDQTLFENLDDVFQDEMPRELAERLLNNGYVLVGGGLLSRDRFVLPDQIERIGDDVVYLNTGAEGLITR